MSLAQYAAQLVTLERHTVLSVSLFFCCRWFCFQNRCPCEGIFFPSFTFNYRWTVATIPFKKGCNITSSTLVKVTKKDPQLHHLSLSTPLNSLHHWQTQASSDVITLAAGSVDVNGNCFGGDLLCPLSSTSVDSPFSLSWMSVPNIKTHQIYYLGDMTHYNLVKALDRKHSCYYCHYYYCKYK